MGTLEILNVQGGDVKLSFNSKDASEAIRAKRYIGEMMKVGFVLLVEVNRDGETAYERALAFDPARGEYIIADFEGANGHTNGNTPPAVQSGGELPAVSGTDEAGPEPETDVKPRRGRRKRVPMEEANATAVGRSAGG